MQIAPAAFWRITLAEWRALLAGHEDRVEAEWQARAWSASYQLVAAGCEPDKVTPAKLLGREEKRPRAKKPAKELSLEEVYARMAKIGPDGKVAKPSRKKGTAHVE